MKIVNIAENVKQVEFKSLKSGDVFEFNNSFYMKTTTGLGGKSQDAIWLRDGYRCHFGKGLVTPVEGYFQVERIG